MKKINIVILVFLLLLRGESVPAEIQTINLFSETDVKKGYEVYWDGSITAEPNSIVTGYIDVEGLTEIYISGLTPYFGLDRYTYFYDSNKKPVGNLEKIGASLAEYHRAVPSDAKYFVMSIYQRKTSSEVIDLDKISIASNQQTQSNTTLKTAGKNFLIFGDSLTQTATVSDDGATYKEGTRENWATYSFETLQMGQMWNYAESGAHYEDITELKPRQKLSTQINTAIANNRPGDIIIISCGINDVGYTLGSYETAMAKTTLESLDRTNLYEAIRWAFWKLRLAYPDAEFFVATPIQSPTYDAIGDSQPIIEAITKMAKRYNFIIINGQEESGIVKDFEVENGAGRYLIDGLHPNSEGQKKMSNLYNRVILNTLNY